MTEPPFDKIPMDLTPFMESGMIEARLEVTDELGLTGSSMALPIEVLVLEPEGGFFSSLGRNVYLIIAGVVGVSGAVLFLVLVLAGRLRPRRIGERRQKRKAAADPVTSPMKVNKEDTQTTGQSAGTPHPPPAGGGPYPMAVTHAAPPQIHTVTWYGSPRMANQTARHFSRSPPKS